MLGLLGSLLPGLFNLGGKMIEDKDKKNEYAFKVLEMTQELSLKMLDVKTYPWIDGLVKLAYASEQIIKGLFRPIAATVMFVFAMYCELNAIELSDTIQTLLYGAFPAWGVSRHVEKKDKSTDAWED